ncbi:replication protein RepA, partial [Acinetobacter radioresistens]
IPTNSPKNDFTLKVPTVEGIHLLYLEINKIFSLSCQPICNSASWL